MFKKMTATDGQGASAVEYVRVKKHEAAKVYASGAPVVLCPAKLFPFGGFRPSMMLQRDLSDEAAREAHGLDTPGFAQRVRDFVGYNANCWETGYYASYWVKPSDLEKVTRDTRPLWFFEVTDVYGGEANYSWVTRHIIRARTQRGAINRFAKLSGMKWHGVGCERFDSESGATCYFVSPYDMDAHGNLFSIANDEREAHEKPSEETAKSA
jgi:hypothetical protein